MATTTDDSAQPSFDSPTETSSSFPFVNPGKAASVPFATLTKDIGKLTKQISAPSYFNSLSENDAPPFKSPDKEPRPVIITDTIMSTDEAVYMVLASEIDKVNGLQHFLGTFLVEKKIIPNYALTERKFLITLLSDVVEYAAQRDFDERKLACMITIYLSSHVYFKWYYWSPPIAVWNYFKELMIRHTIEHSPDGEEVFEPDECYDIVTHFHTIYMNNLPLIHIATFGAYRLKFVWPFKGK